MARRATLRGTPDVRLENERKLTRRSLRSPSHTFRLKVRPFQIVPAVVAPVLPGDTIKAASLKMRVLSKPINDRLSGWWLETYLFYVRLGDLDDGAQDAFKDMILTGAAFPDTSAASVPFYGASTFWDGYQEMYTKIVETYFRNEGPDDTNYPIGDYQACKVGGPGGLFDSLAIAADMDDGPPDDADEWVKKWEAYQGMRNAKVTTATWEEYLAAQGVALPPQLVQTAANRMPELFHFQRDWQFPVNAVEPSTGVPAALVQWSLASRTKRGRFCAEPGFVWQLVVARPKALLKNQRAHAAGYVMDQREAWMPSALDTDPHARLRMFDGVGTVGGSGDGPVYGAVEDYWVDPTDLLLRGDQFTNYDLGSTVAGALAGINTVDLPGTDGNTLYPDGDDADALFAGSDKWIEVDGVTTMQVASVAGRGDPTGKRAGMS